MRVKVLSSCLLLCLQHLGQAFLPCDAKGLRNNFGRKGKRLGGGRGGVKERGEGGLCLGDLTSLERWSPPLECPAPAARASTQPVPLEGPQPSGMSRKPTHNPQHSSQKAVNLCTVAVLAQSNMKTAGVWSLQATGHTLRSIHSRVLWDKSEHTHASCKGFSLCDLSSRCAP